MPLGQNLKLRAALGTGTTAAAGRFDTTQYLVGGGAGRIRQWTLASTTMALLVRFGDVSSGVPFSNRAAGSNSGIAFVVGANLIQTQLFGTATVTYDLALTAEDNGKAALLVFTNYSAVSRQTTLNGRRVVTNAVNCGINAAVLPGIPTIGVTSPSGGAVGSPWPGGIYDIAICYSKAIAAADQQAFFEQVVAEGGLPSSCMGTRWDHFMRAESFSGRVGVSQAQLPDVAGGVNFKLAGTAAGSPSTLALSPLRALSFGPTG